MKVEVRYHYYSGQRVIMSENRNKRPKDYIKESTPLPKEKYNPSCPFCFGNEKMTPKEVYLVGGKNWQIRAFPNKFPLLDSSLKFYRKKTKLFDKRSGYGFHEVLVDTPLHNEQWQDFSKKKFEQIFSAYKERYIELIKKPEIKYVMLFRNYSYLGGASLVHSHSQILATPFLPTNILRDIHTLTDYSKEYYSCAYCDIVSKESSSSRLVYENKEFIVLSPYCARYPFELWIISKKHLSDFSDLNIPHFADAIQKSIKGLFLIFGDLPYNFFIHHLPKSIEGEFHFHAEIQPRLKTEASVEFGYGIKVNTFLPERAAKKLREVI